MMSERAGKEMMELIRLAPAYDRDLAALIRRSLRAHRLDIPGTAYYDEGLDHLSTLYSRDPEQSAYFVLTEGERVLGGIGMAALEGFPDCAELQKLYLDDSVKGKGLGYRLIRHIEETALGMGYRRMYLETHTNLQAAIHIYEKCGYRRIDRPAFVIHSTMNRFYLKELCPPAEAAAVKQQ